MRSNVVLAGALVLTLGLVVSTGRSSPDGPRPPHPVAGAAAPVVQPVALRSGQKPPQFVIVSFDGAGDHKKWTFWRDVRRSGMRFTAFLSGAYLLDRTHRTQYAGPGHVPGASSLGGWNTRARSAR